MATIMIADFTGMTPIRDPLLLPDNTAQDCVNAWLYRGQVRGFRTSIEVYQSVYADTQQVYRIPKDPTVPFDFTTTGSLWLEFPDPFMSVIRNPTVGDTHDRYYFFPSDEYKSTGVNPLWPAAVPPAVSPGPVYNTYARLLAGDPMYTLGIAIPVTPPTVTPPPSYITMLTTGATAIGEQVLHFAATTIASVNVGMYALDLTDHRLVANTTAAAAVGTATLTFSSTTGILAGMSVICTNKPTVVFPNTQVAPGVTSTQITLNYNLVGNVAIGDTFQFDNVNQIVAGTTVTKVDNPTGQVTINTAVIAAGVPINDTIQFLTSIPETRAYLYTFISDFDEESQPSPATVASGDGSGTWVIVIPGSPCHIRRQPAIHPR